MGGENTDADVQLNQPTTPDVMAELRKRFEGLPEDMTIDAFVEQVHDLAGRVEKSAQAEADAAEAQARAAAEAAAATAETQESSTTEPDEYELPWKPVKIDQNLRALVRQDPNSGMFIPSIATSVPHIRAAEELNRRVQYEHAVSNALFDDPKGFVDTLTKKQLAALRKEMSEQIEALKSQLEPIGKHLETTKSKEQESKLFAQHRDKLVDAEGNLTPLGEQVDLLMTEFEIPLEKALAKLEARQKASPPKQTQQAAQKPPEEKPKRFIDTLSRSTRALTERAEGDEPPRKSVPDLGAFRRKYAGNGNGR